MTYTVSTNDSKGRAHHWWAYFLAYGIRYDTSRYDIQYWLDHHNSHGTFDLIGQYIEFETAQDFTIFVLKWS